VVRFVANRSFRSVLDFSRHEQAQVCSGWLTPGNDVDALLIGVTSID
jgi:hypothetical protein